MYPIFHWINIIQFYRANWLWHSQFLSGTTTTSTTTTTTTATTAATTNSYSGCHPDAASATTTIHRTAHTSAGKLQ